MPLPQSVRMCLLEDTFQEVLVLRTAFSSQQTMVLLGLMLTCRVLEGSGPCSRLGRNSLLEQQGFIYQRIMAQVGLPRTWGLHARTPGYALLLPLARIFLREQMAMEFISQQIMEQTGLPLIMA